MVVQIDYRVSFKLIMTTSCKYPKLSGVEIVELL